VGGAIWGEPMVSIRYAIKTLVKGMSSLHPNLIKIWLNLEKPFKTVSRHPCLEVKNLMNGRTKAAALASALLIAMSLVAGGLSLVYAETDQGDAPPSSPINDLGGWRMRGPTLACLDEEQRQELQEALDAMRDEGASHEEIREYVKMYLEEHDVERLEPQLTDEQMEGLRQLRAEIQELIQRRLGELGIDRSFMERGELCRGAGYAHKHGS